MSRAFVKEAENDKADLSDRPISPQRNLVTEAGLASIEAALGRFEAAHRDATDKGDREAADHVLATFKTQLEAIDWSRKNGYAPLVARVRHLNDKRKPDHWRAA
jgi:hypothetical protein